MSEALQGSEPLQVDQEERCPEEKPHWVGKGVNHLHLLLPESEEAARSLEQDPVEAEARFDPL